MSETSPEDPEMGRLDPATAAAVRRKRAEHLMDLADLDDFYLGLDEIIASFGVTQDELVSPEDDPGPWDD